MSPGGSRLVICWVVFMDVDRMPALARNSPRAQQREKLQTKSRGRRVQGRAPGAMSAPSCITQGRQRREDNLAFVREKRRRGEERMCGPRFSGPGGGALLLAAQCKLNVKSSRIMNCKKDPMGRECLSWQNDLVFVAQDIKLAPILRGV